ncbi:hypothetical protein PI124_g6424 [Phytophthora idaei]|nr:hypothetical protein PI125_g14980 [Phytophthora idaei]KAG3163977.1 hypothetical protein PI126_g5296 [Phytophthora idaei]KAG3248909.1 hypothetical protein PI124_g6424 [Phytophthora idaei]
MKDPQGNAICDRGHLDLLNITRCYANVGWTNALHYAVFANYHSILNASPVQLVFGQDMISRKLHQSNRNYMSKRGFEANIADNDREINKRIEHFYAMSCFDSARLFNRRCELLPTARTRPRKFATTTQSPSIRER